MTVSEISSAMDSEDTSSSEASSSRERKIVQFNEFGLPVGANSAQLLSRSGELVRTYVPISFTDWRLVPEAKKEELWELMKLEFVLPEFYKSHCLKRMAEQFRKFRATLRTTYMDCFDNIDDMLENVPPMFKHEDWEDFVKQNSSPDAISTQKINKANRKHLKIYHRTGRHGHARLKEIMKKETGDDKPIPRAKVWIKAHTRKDGSIPSSVAPFMEKLIRLSQSQSGTSSTDLLNDPLTKVFGRDKKGRVRSVRSTVSRSQIQGSAPTISKLLEKDAVISSQKEDRDHIKVDMKEIQVTLAQIRQEVRALKKSGVPLTLCASSSKPLDGDAIRSERDCFLHDWYGNAVATGRVITEAGKQKVHGYPWG